jgi:uncharacterized membrane protein
MIWTALYKLFYLVCHQMPDRSPRFEGAVFPACYRCAGLYFGIMCSYVFLGLRGGWRRSFPSRNYALAVTVPVAIFVTDAWGNGLGLWDSTGWLRALTGLGAGIAIPVLLLPLVGEFAESTPSLQRLGALVWPGLAGGGLVWLLDHPGSAAIFQGMATICAAGLAAVAVNLAVAFQVYFHERIRSSSGAVSDMLRAGSGD